MKDFDFFVQTIKDYGWYQKVIDFNLDMPNVSYKPFAFYIELVIFGSTYNALKKCHYVILKDYGVNGDIHIYSLSHIHETYEGNLIEGEYDTKNLLGIRKIDGNAFVYVKTQQKGFHIGINVSNINSYGQFIYAVDDNDYLSSSEASSNLIFPVFPTSNIIKTSTNKFNGNNSVILNSSFDNSNIVNTKFLYNTYDKIEEYRFGVRKITKLKWKTNSYDCFVGLSLPYLGFNMSITLKNSPKFKIVTLPTDEYVDYCIRKVEESGNYYYCLYIQISTNNSNKTFAILNKNDVSNNPIDVSYMESYDSEYTSGTELTKDIAYGSGIYANKPKNVAIGIKYFCTDRQTTEGAIDGIEIIHKGNDVWVDTLGRVVS